MKKIFAIVCTVAFFMVISNFPTFALYVDGEKRPMAQILNDLRTNSEAVFSRSGAGTYQYLTTEMFQELQLTRETYEIRLEVGAEMPENMLEDLGLITKYAEGVIVPIISEDMVEISSSKYGIDGNLNEIYFVEKEPGIFEFSFSPAWYRIDERVFISYLQTLPTFLSVTYDAVGYYANDLSDDFTYDTSEYTFFIQTKTANELSVEDFPEELCVKKVVKNIDEYRDYVGVQLDINTLGGNEEDQMYHYAQELLNMEQIQNVWLDTTMVDDSVDVTPYLIDNGAIPYVTRGDCDENETIDANDAYLALRHYAAGSVGSASVLSDRNRCAADINGNGKVDADDAYLMLKYYAAKSVGSDAQWSDILQ